MSLLHHALQLTFQVSPQIMFILNIVILGYAIAASAIATTRYTIPLPEGITVADSQDQLNQLAAANPNSVLYDESGGYILRDADTGVMFAVASDDLIDEINAAVNAANAVVEARELNEGVDGETNAPIGKRYDGGYTSNFVNHCTHPRCFYSATCLRYSNCHICSSSTRKICI
jgi:hypothetical protein